MFNNLKAEITRKGMNNSNFAELLDMNPRLFNKKLLGKSEFKRSEMKKIKEILGENDFSLEYLFDF